MYQMIMHKSDQQKENCIIHYSQLEHDNTLFFLEHEKHSMFFATDLFG